MTDHIMTLYTQPLAPHVNPPNTHMEELRRPSALNPHLVLGCIRVACIVIPASVIWSVACMYLTIWDLRNAMIDYKADIDKVCAWAAVNSAYRSLKLRSKGTQAIGAVMNAHAFKEC
jgi:hypothetical protein